MTQQDTETTVTKLFDRVASGAPGAELAEFFSENVDWYIPGNTAEVPWIGRKHGRAGVAEFYEQLAIHTSAEQFTLGSILTDGTQCVVLGELLTRVNRTGERISTEFAVDIRVEDGLITRYHMFEDTYAVAMAYRG